MGEVENLKRIHPLPYQIVKADDFDAYTPTMFSQALGELFERRECMINQFLNRIPEDAWFSKQVWLRIFLGTSTIQVKQCLRQYCAANGNKLYLFPSMKNTVQVET